jgi:hypothetical protein
MSSPNPASTGGSTSTVGGGFAQPDKPKMTDEELRLQCVQLAVAAHVDPKTITASASRFFDYIKSGTVSSGASVTRNEGA